ncbi:PEP-CTERM sorting domain-containing protein [Coraliomargarita algicola]|uniref:PEP-CTERM sorting domain-containing protein n=1 Tax=Coraliomargarita algicola TaxID=3092156 RepID=A0ABZ0RVE4_9BACT|nr:PEP-CTERM sorting domain-containing protein [Coraliomargarita sp. J2-16]WPJ96934.1 PEP-CTERM sorting domain-containing protein [Coraliomargarita sp. J2-16]
MKIQHITTILAGISLFAALPSSASSIFFSFQSQEDGNGTATLDVTAFDGIASGTPTISPTGGAAGDGGEASFTAYDDSVWLGNGNFATPGHSLVYGVGSGFSLSLNFDATNLEDMTVRFAVRTAGSGAVTQLSDLTYDIGAGAVSTGLTGGFFPANGQFQELTFDLSSIAAIENQSDVTLTWLIPEVVSGTSFRIDNVQLSAVPEPSNYGLLMGGLVAGMLMQRRRRC